MNLRQRLAELGLSLPPAPKPVATYVPAVQTGDLVFISGQLPVAQGQLLATGPVPSAVDLPTAQLAARQCLLNALAILDDHLAGDWSRLVRIVRLGIFVASDPTFYDQPKVANGASELLVQLFGPAGTHARATLGVPVLPLNATVELELLAQIRSAS